MLNSSFIITGPKRAGKSTLCWHLLKYIRKQTVATVGGVITLQNRKRFFYLISEHKRIPFETSNDQDFIKIGHYKIHKQNLKLAIDSIQQGIGSDILFIDEIGILELRKRGYHPVLKTAFSRDKSNILVVRQSILDEFIVQYPQVSDYEVLKVVDREIITPFNIIKNYVDQLTKY
ncbi:MAG: nucleoside-triphosphatase [Candidatus Hermodarchaeota archaeon]